MHPGPNAFASQESTYCTTILRRKSLSASDQDLLSETGIMGQRHALRMRIPAVHLAYPALVKDCAWQVTVRVQYSTFHTPYRAMEDKKRRLYHAILLPGFGTITMLLLYGVESALQFSELPFADVPARSNNGSLCS